MPTQGLCCGRQGLTENWVGGVECRWRSKMRISSHGRSPAQAAELDLIWIKVNSPGSAILHLFMRSRAMSGSNTIPSKGRQALMSLVRRILAAAALFLAIFLAGPEAQACDSHHSRAAAGNSISLAHRAKLAPAGVEVFAEVILAEKSVSTSPVHVSGVGLFCESPSEADGFGCTPGQCCPACSSAISAPNQSIASPAGSGDHVSFIPDRNSSTELITLFRPPRALA